MQERKTLVATTVKLSDAHYAKINALRQSEGNRSVASIVREALNLYFQNKEGA